MIYMDNYITLIIDKQGNKTSLKKNTLQLVKPKAVEYSQLSGKEFKIIIEKKFYGYRITRSKT